MTQASDPEGPENYLRRYLEEVNAYPLLSDGEARDLLEVVTRDALGAESAKRRVIEANLRLVSTSPRGINAWDDIFSI